MLDDNIVSDYRKIMQLFGIGDRQTNYAILEELIVNGAVIGTPKYKLELEKSFDRDDFISLLLYMGFVTIDGTVLTDIRYVIPNYVIHRLYYEYFKVEIEQYGQVQLDTRSLRDAIAAMALDGNISLLTAEIRKALALFSNRDFMRMDEKHIKAVILTLLYQSEVYFIQSEPEVNNCYPDILLLERNPIEVKYQFLLELKFVKKKEGTFGWQEKKEQGMQQVAEYLQLKEMKRLSSLQGYLILTNGSDLEIVQVREG